MLEKNKSLTLHVRLELQKALIFAGIFKLFGKTYQYEIDIK